MTAERIPAVPDASASAPTPYAGLTPTLVLDALDSVGLRGDGRLLQLNSYENRVLQVCLEDGSVVVAKFYRPARWTDAQILEEHAFALELSADEIPVVPPLSLMADDATQLQARVQGAASTLATVTSDAGSFRFSVSPRRSGRGPDLSDPHTLAWLGRFIGRMHAIGARGPFVHRRRLDVATLGAASRDWLIEHDTVPDTISAVWRETADMAIAAAARRFDECAGVPSIRLHGDCHPGNVLWTEAGPHFVDLDDAMNGPAVQDLWMLLSGDRETMAQQMTTVLGGYEGFMDFDRRELGLIEPLRTLRMLHHSAWLAQRFDDPAFPAAFPFFGTNAYWSEQIQQLREQIEAMAEAPLQLRFGIAYD